MIIRPGPYAAVVRGFSAFALLPAVERDLERRIWVLRAQGCTEERIAQVLVTVAEIRDAAEAWQELEPSGAGRTEVGRTEVGGSSSHDEISSSEAGDLLGVGARRVGQLVDEQQLDGRKVGGRWLVSKESVVSLMNARRSE